MLITCEAYNRRLRDLMALAIFITVSATASVMLTPRDARKATHRAPETGGIERRAASQLPPTPGGDKKARKSAARESVAAGVIFAPSTVPA